MGAGQGPGQAIGDAKELVSECDGELELIEPGHVVAHPWSAWPGCVFDAHEPVANRWRPGIGNVKHVYHACTVPDTTPRDPGRHVDVLRISP